MKLPRNLFDLHADLAAEKCSWQENFSLRIVRKALVCRFEVTSLNSSIEMLDNARKMAAREKRANEARTGPNARVSQQPEPSMTAP